MKLHVKEHSIYDIVEMFCFLDVTHIVTESPIILPDVTGGPMSGSTTHLKKELH